MKTLLRVAFVSTVSLALLSCGSDDADDNSNTGNHSASCSGVTCSGHGTCNMVSGVAVCVCDSGYLANGTQCTAISATSCDGQDCSGHGTCVMSGGNAVCDCDDGYQATGLTCVETGTGFAGSCTIDLGSGMTGCMEYIGSGYTPTTTEQGCVQSDGTYSSARCSTAGLSGKCTGMAGATQYVTFYYGVPTDQVSIIESSCTRDRKSVV
jgi:hypothetical protein